MVEGIPEILNVSSACLILSMDSFLLSPMEITLASNESAIVSAQMLSKVNFDKLLMAHQDSPLLEGSREAVETLVAESIQKLKR